jgi:hypothetical protein
MDVNLRDLYLISDREKEDAFKIGALFFVLCYSNGSNGLFLSNRFVPQRHPPLNRVKLDQYISTSQRFHIPKVNDHVAADPDSDGLFEDINGTAGRISMM